MSTMKVDRPSVRFAVWSLRGGPGQEKHQVGVFGAAGPDLLAVDDIGIAVPARECPQRGGVGAAGRFGHPECLQPQFAGGDFRQVCGFLLVGAVAENGPHDVHLGVTGRAVAALGLDCFQDGRGGRQWQSGAAVFLGDQRAKVAGLGQRAHEIGRVAALLVELRQYSPGKRPQSFRTSSRISACGSWCRVSLMAASADGVLRLWCLPAIGQLAGGIGACPGSPLAGSPGKCCYRRPM